MPSKMLYLLIAVGLLAGMAFFAWSAPSYEKAFEAKWYYFTGASDEAQRLAEEAYRLDPYNRMALTVKTRAARAKELKNYVEEGREYLEKIDAIASKGVITKPDEVRIKMMIEIMVQRYRQIKPTPLDDMRLLQEARGVYQKFETLERTLFR